MHQIKCTRSRRPPQLSAPTIQIRKRRLSSVLGRIRVRRVLYVHLNGRELTYPGRIPQILVVGMLFYDGPTPPAGLFDTFLNTPSLLMDVKTRNFSDLVGSSSSQTLEGFRYACIRVGYGQYATDVFLCTGQYTIPSRSLTTQNL
jgi:hypothetical protein